MTANGVQLVAIGQIERLPPRLRSLIDELQEEAKAELTLPRKMTLCLAISYGGRSELAEAAKRLVEMSAAGKLAAEDVNEGALESCLSTAQLGLPDPDLVVRTSGVKRLSNLLLWQAAYAELYVAEKCWPDFRQADLEEAFRDYGRRRRRFGMTPEQVTGEKEA
ncbi:unnamed protein product [Discosporangium mesarthrocarpum]